MRACGCSSKDLRLTAALAGLLIACASPKPPARVPLESRFGPERAAAIVQLGQARDPDAVPALVELLEDDDRGIRMYAILALERLTGQTLGYRYQSSEGERSAAAQRWREAIRDGRVQLLASTDR